MSAFDGFVKFLSAGKFLIRGNFTADKPYYTWFRLKKQEEIVIIADVSEGNAWVLEDQGQVVGTAYLGMGKEPTYAKIYEGTWGAEPETYAFLHRIAVAGSCKGKGAAEMFFQQLEREARARGLNVLRGDTHRDNKIMQRVMEKNGLQYRGIIYLADGDQRLAFEKILK